MSYHIYTTKGVVLSQLPIKEADRIYNVLTRDLGLVRARAVSVRKGASKLRGNVEPVSLANISFVRGKGEWKLISAELIKAIPADKAILKPLFLLEQLVQGEAHHPELFDMVEGEVQSAKIFDESFEIRFVANILYHLGYLREEDLSLDKKDLVRAINEGLEQSQLT